MSRAGAWRLGILGGAVALLELLCRLGAIKKITMIPPSEMALALGRLMAGPAMWPHAAKTFGNVAWAFLIAVLAGATIGVVLHALPGLRRALDPWLATWYAVPVFVFYPLFIVLFGMGDAPIIAIAFLFSVAAMTIATLDGLGRIPRVLRKTARVHRLTPIERALRIDLPSAFPYLLTGVKLALAYAFIGVIASEFILSGFGLGHEISFAYNNFDNRTMYGLMLFLLTAVVLINLVVQRIERRELRRRGR
ncbi:MAG: ABC transporter permease subunit [Alphaproteobacteria bacterium]|nr:ABC transporter permease subunit [Alphaproteobacteria bacterium]